MWTDLRDYWRQLELPECPHCGSTRIEPSALRRRETPLAWLGLLPYRCGRCLRRSYLRPPAPHSGVKPPTTGRGRTAV